MTKSFPGSGEQILTSFLFFLLFFFQESLESLCSCRSGRCALTFACWGEMHRDAREWRRFKVAPFDKKERKKKRLVLYTWAPPKSAFSSTAAALSSDRPGLHSFIISTRMVHSFNQTQSALLCWNLHIWFTDTYSIITVQTKWHECPLKVKPISVAVWNGSGVEHVDYRGSGTQRLTTLLRYNNSPIGKVSKDIINDCL